MMQRRLNNIVRHILIGCLVFFSCATNVLSAKDKGSMGTALIITSYNLDSERISSFLTQFDEIMVQEDVPIKIFVEDLGCRGMQESHLWRPRMENILRKYPNEDIATIILLGQEAFSTFVSLDKTPNNIPFFGCFFSENGIILPEFDVSEMDTLWQPEPVNMLARARARGMAGGMVNRYHVVENVRLIRSIYPQTKNIAFVSDNTYGGISIQALFRKEITKFPDINPIYIDARLEDEQIDSMIVNLPDHTVVMMGAWRQNRKNNHYLSCSFNRLISKVKHIPVFTLTGSELRSTAIGGYVPDYAANPGFFVKQIIDYYGNDLTPYFRLSKSIYKFDSEKLHQFDIDEGKIPSGSILMDNLEGRLMKYKLYIQTGVLAFVILIILLLFVFYFFYKNKRLNNSLKEREAELIKAKDKAEESDRLKSSFLANMSHEIRTPLNSIVGFSMLLSEQELSDEEKKEYSSIIAGNSDMLLSLINDILDMSKLEANRIVFNLAPVDVLSLCKDILATTSYSRGDGVVYRFEHKMPNLVINIDAKRLSQVLINLLVNAGKFTKNGEIVLSVEDDETQDNMLKFMVSDTGAGVPVEMQKTVFDRFEKINQFDQGTGLGLAICKQIVTKFGGRIWIDSNYTQGARFVFTIRKDFKQN